MGEVTVRIRTPEIEPSDIGCRLVVQLRDTSLEDIVHPVVAETTTEFPEAPDGFDVELEVPESVLRQGRHTVWVHCDHTGDGRVGAGDLITTQAFHVDPDSSEPVEVTLSRV